jgi:hypothetical protein
MLKFLANDFDNPKWRTASLKNAFALISKQRFGESTNLLANDGSSHEILFTSSAMHH